MTIDEFRAWLDGFQHAINGSPNAEQWKLICEKVDKLQVLRISANELSGLVIEQHGDPSRAS